MSTRNAIIVLGVLLAAIFGLYRLGAFDRQAAQTPEVPSTAVTAKELRDEYVALGYPTDQQLPAEFAQKIFDAFNDGQLYTINALDNGYARVSLVSVADTSEINHEYCGLYSPGLCLIIYESGEEQRILQTFVAMRGAPLENLEPGHVELDQFLFDEYGILLSTSFGDGPEGQQTFWTLDLESGELAEVVKQKFSYDGDNWIVALTFSRDVGEQEVFIDFKFTERSDEESGNALKQYTYLTIRDAGGYLLEEPLDLPIGDEPVAMVDALSTLEAPGKIVFFVYVRPADPEALEAPVTRIYQYDAKAEPRLTLLREIP